MIDDEDSFLGGLSAKLAACGEGAGTEEEAVCRAAAEVGGDVVREVQRTVHMAAVALQLGVAPVPRVVAQPARFSVAGSKNQPFFLCLFHINSCRGVNPLMYHSPTKVRTII